MPLKSHRTW